MAQVKTAVSIEESLFREAWAGRLGISRNRLFAEAVRTNGDRNKSSLGGRILADIEPAGSSPGYTRPYVVVQNDVFRNSGTRTVVTCALSTNLRRTRDVGNVLLFPGEASLPEQSVVNVSRIAAVDKRRLRERGGTLSAGRVREVLRGINLLLEPRSVGG